MKVSVEIDDMSYDLDVPDTLAGEAGDFFARMDADMDNGWQMSRWWVPDPDALQRCQIAADKLLTAIQKNQNEAAMMMCAYILRSRPDTRRIVINTAGEIQANEFHED